MIGDGEKSRASQRDETETNKVTTRSDSDDRRKKHVRCERNERLAVGLGHDIVVGRRGGRVRDEERTGVVFSSVFQRCDRLD